MKNFNSAMLCFAVSLFAAASAHAQISIFEDLVFANGQDSVVTLDRVRYKKSWLNWNDHPDYPQWDDHGVTKDNRKQMMIAIISEPPRGDVENLVLLSAGQQGIDFLFPGSGYDNVVTGQTEGYKNGFGSGDSSI